MVVIDSPTEATPHRRLRRQDRPTKLKPKEFHGERLTQRASGGAGFRLIMLVKTALGGSLKTPRKDPHSAGSEVVEKETWQKSLFLDFPVSRNPVSNSSGAGAYFFLRSQRGIRRANL